MANYSRPKDDCYYPGSSFNPEKYYIGIRMQQGVPLLDSDWNELNDVTRHELYESFKFLLPDAGLPPEIPSMVPFYPWRPLGIFPMPKKYLHGSLSKEEIIANLSIKDFLPDDKQVKEVYKEGYEDNDFIIAPAGKRGIIVGGKTLKINDCIFYSEQPGITKLDNNPKANQVDLVYLDVWEEEVDGKDDPEIINKSIGIETCVRIQRKFLVKVFENCNSFESFEEKQENHYENHYYMPLALLYRDTYPTTPPIPPISWYHIKDIRPFIQQAEGIREVSLSPVFQPLQLCQSQALNKTSTTPDSPSDDDNNSTSLGRMIDGRMIEASIKAFDDILKILKPQPDQVGNLYTGQESGISCWVNTLGVLKDIFPNISENPFFKDNQILQNIPQLVAHNYTLSESKQQASSVVGMIPLSLPQGGKMLNLRVWVSSQGPIYFSILRFPNLWLNPFTSLSSQFYDKNDAYLLEGQAKKTHESKTKTITSVIRTWDILKDKHIVDNSQYHYVLFASTDVWKDSEKNKSYPAIIHGLSIVYEY